MNHFSLIALKIFSLSFDSLLITCYCGVLWFILKFAKFLYLYVKLFPQTWEVFGHYFFSLTLSLLGFLLFVYLAAWWYLISHLCSIIFFSSDLGTSNDLVSGSLIIYFAYLILLNPSSESFNLVLISPCSIISVWFSFVLLILLATLHEVEILLWQKWLPLFLDYSIIEFFFICICVCINLCSFYGSEVGTVWLDAIMVP